MAGGSTRKERKADRVKARRKRPAPMADDYTPRLFVRRAYVPPRAIKWEQPDRMPKRSREWAALYLDGMSPEAISLGEGGYYKPWTIRRELKKWGVPMRRPGGRNSAGWSPLARIATIEQTLAHLVTEVDRIVAHLDIAQSFTYIGSTELP